MVLSFSLAKQITEFYFYASNVEWLTQPPHLWFFHNPQAASQGY